MTKRILDHLTPTSFENLCFDIVRDMAFINPTWRTPGADGGRDIEAWRTIVDPTFVVYNEQWFIECKRYGSAISWPTIYEKIAHAEALGADYLFLMTTSSASPTCIDRVNSWNNQKKKPKVRIWSGYDITAHLSIRPALEIKYGLGTAGAASMITEGVALEMAKVISTVHSLSSFGRDASCALEYANALARCWTERVSQLRSRGAFFPFPKDIKTYDQAALLSAPVERQMLSRGELLVLLWIIFVLEVSGLHVCIYKDHVSAKISSAEFEIISTTPSSNTILYLSSVTIRHFEENLIIEESLYA